MRFDILIYQYAKGVPLKDRFVQGYYTVGGFKYSRTFAPFRGKATPKECKLDKQLGRFMLAASFTSSLIASAISIQDEANFREREKMENL
ncbi:hypothetical protein [Klebsiella pneumoniae]|uniref:hypothetical protein n=1 Tax=Klebsiella pneumoniae TaxID=573 RepID=UPI001034A1D0|nr:hypothetical protein [Klebsiella pneumoniae]